MDGKPYVFFDLSLFNFILSNSNHKTEVHVCHEIVHGIHYFQNPEYYQGNYKTIEDKYIKKMKAEGTASYLSELITGCKLIDAMGFGFMGEDEFENWIDECNELRESYFESINRAIKDNIFDKELYNRLFFMCGDSITDGRYGYYYGYKEYGK